MSLDKLVDSTQLDADLTIVANAIRTKGGTSAQLTFPTDFVTAIGAIPSGGTYQAKTNISPATSSQTIYPDTGYDALSSVQINAMPSGTAGTPTAAKGTVSNHSVSVTPSVTNTTGYITGSTKTGTAVTVSASELVSGSETKTANGTYDVTNLAELVVNVSGGGGGLEYETGTYTPASDTSNTTVSFAKTHSTTPILIAATATDVNAISSTNSNSGQIYFDVYRLFGAGYPRNNTNLSYSMAIYLYRSTGSAISTGIYNINNNSDDTSDGNAAYARYWADASKFRIYSNSSSRYLRSGATIKWIAVWAPTT